MITYELLPIPKRLRVIIAWNGVPTDTLGVAVISKPKNANELGTCNFIENYFILCEQVGRYIKHENS